MTRRRRLRRAASYFLYGLTVGALIAMFVVFILWASTQKGLLS